MSRKPVSKPPSGNVPKPRTAVNVPKPRAQGHTPTGAPPSHAPTRHIGRKPNKRATGKVPNPRKPELVRDVRGGSLKDLMEIFPDLPRPARPVRRVQISSVRRPRLR